ncbi:hypothetical protein ACFWBV_18215 [Streptomyces sp. NPDC060030]|uniref:hypothetical protein n=1 Tax=Streptomyces sp. NPDC060030 TaxID=3347042 RepID=UPI00369AAD33
MPDVAVEYGKGSLLVGERDGQPRAEREHTDLRLRLRAARGAVYAVEGRMIDTVPARRLTALLTDLDTMTAALDG